MRNQCLIICRLFRRRDRRDGLRRVAGATIIAWSIATAPNIAVADLLVPGDFATIAGALNAIENGTTSERTITVEPGRRNEDLSISADLPAGVVLRGRETARTILTGTLTATNVLDFRISNFSFTGGGPAVQISGGDVTVANNVFRLGTAATAITATFSQPEIVNNVFYRVGTAIDAGSNAAIIENNAFFENDATIVAAGNGSAISNNSFFDSEAFGDAAVSGNPLFVDAGIGDFHLRANSPLIDAGIGNDALDDSEADIGAYGGDFAEGTPFPVQDPVVASIDSDGLDNSITLEWQENLWYRLDGYRVYYDDDDGPPYAGTGADAGDSPIDAGDATSFIIEGLATPSADLEPPVLDGPEPGDQRLVLSWSASPGADGYLVRYRVDGSADETTVDVGNVTSHTLTGLVNGTVYRIEVSAYAQPGYVFSVIAYPDFDDDLESEFSTQVEAEIGPQIESLPSNEITDFPEPIIIFPELPDENGCFIATAAYGYYGAPEVQLLRRFRDQYLATHAPGRALVSWYYRHSPDWAESLQRHPELKPLVRLALLPCIVIAACAVNHPLLVACSIVLLFVVLVFSRARQRAVTFPGAVR